ncbi:MAG: prepilin-type N-terminal cleavage/methylation domain-containing protein [Fibromonadaceae bacterium]|jgi:prepilin-type N-terminal cleavage/methylation domain-containing protein|nr:prepilin-type N-terminal cleavage/methylation domain-containing protein [Fibromonadaceae bacterium]
MKKGFTLIELLVYMIIMGFIIVVAGRVFSDSTSMRVRSQNMVKSMEDAGQVANLIKEDLSQAGTKTWAEDAAGRGCKGTKDCTIGFTKEVADKVYERYKDDENDEGADFSSYSLEEFNGLDNIAFQKVHYDNEGVYKAVQQIRWFVEDHVLKRSCQSIAGEPSIECPGEPAVVEMAKDVTKFKLLPSKPGTRDNEGGDIELLSGNFWFKHDGVGKDDIKTGGGTNRVTLEKLPLAKEGNLDNIVQHCLSKDGSTCKQFQFVRGETYAIEFEVPYEDEEISGCDKSLKKCKYSRIASLFRPGKDHLSIGVRKSGGGYAGIPEFLFYPPQDQPPPGDKHKFEFEFGVTKDIEDASIYLTVAIYNEEAGDGGGGQITIKDLKVNRKQDRAYYFDEDDEDYPPTEKEKRHVKAFKLDLEIEKKGEKSKASMVIPVPNNGVFVHAEG